MPLLGEVNKQWRSHILADIKVFLFCLRKINANEGEQFGEWSYIANGIEST